MATVHDNDGNLLTQIRTDGYVNATSLCNFSNKRWSEYIDSDSTIEFISLLSQHVASNKPLIEQDEVTWVHPEIAVHLVHWCSPFLSVHLPKLFLNSKQDNVLYIAYVKCSTFEGIKFGVSQCISKREKQHKNIFDKFQLLRIYRTNCNLDLETVLKKGMKDRGLLKSAVISSRNQTELISIPECDLHVVYELIDSYLRQSNIKMTTITYDIQETSEIEKTVPHVENIVSTTDDVHVKENCRRLIDKYRTYIVDNAAPDSFVIDLIDVCTALQCRKCNVVKTLRESYQCGIDYTVDKDRLLMRYGGNNYKRVMLTPRTFKNMCMKSRSQNAKYIREFMIEIPNQ